MDGNRIENQIFTETYAIHELLSDSTMGTWQADYSLTELEFRSIRGGGSSVNNFANGLLLTTIGFGLNLLAKGLSFLFDLPQEIYSGEWCTLAIGVILTIVFYSLGYFVKSERKVLIKKIEAYFKDAPKQKGIVQGARV
ncbi:hypothetical protein V6243_07170 [Cobetia marina]|uniref:Uncharacterized protein n=1 Tax=Cobetia marina TaxID=28258 RepID=A0ABU9GDQ5_COBMA